MISKYIIFLHVLIPIKFKFKFKFSLNFHFEKLLAKIEIYNFAVKVEIYQKFIIGSYPKQAEHC